MKTSKVQYNLLYIIFISYALLPKFGFNNNFIYIQEVIYLYFIFLNKNVSLTKDYNLVFISNILLIGYLIVQIVYIDENIFLIKYLHQALLFFILILIPTDNKINYEQLLRSIIKCWAFVILINILVIIINYIINQPTLLDFLFNYTPLLRIMGLTGSGITFSGEYRSGLFGNEIGTTSVSISILLALLILIISFSTEKYKNYYCFIFFTGLLFSFSRSGIVILIFSFIISLFNKEFIEYRKIIIKCTIPYILLSGFLGDLFFGSLNKFNFFEIENIGTAYLRMQYWSGILNFFIDKPIYLLFGKSFFSIATNIIVGSDYSESLLFDLILNFGLIGFLYFIIIFYWLFKITKIYNNYIPDIFNLIKSFNLFIPGFLFVNLFSGSSLLTDFLLPLIILIVIIIKNNSLKNKKIQSTEN